MKVKLTRPLGGRYAGDEIEVTKGAAQHLTRTGVAEAIIAKPDSPPASRRAKSKGRAKVGGDSPSPSPGLTAG